MLEGLLSAETRDCAISYRSGEKVAAVATVFRDQQSLLTRSSSKTSGSDRGGGENRQLTPLSSECAPCARVFCTMTDEPPFRMQK